jgi:hypothetical protein
MNKLDKLIELGFKQVGTWSISGNKLELNLNVGHKTKDVLYGFVIDNDIKYIGKTIEELQKRLYGYKNPGPTQRTNIKNNKKINDSLISGKIIKIYALLDTEPIKYKSVKINLAAGLEDVLIKELSPEWNDLGKE